MDFAHCFHRLPIHYAADLTQVWRNVVVTQKGIRLIGPYGHFSLYCFHFVFGLRLGRAGVLISPGGMHCEDDNACVAGTVVVAGEYVAHLGSLEQWRWLHTRKEMPLDIAQAGPGLAAGIGLDASKDEVALGGDAVLLMDVLPAEAIEERKKQIEVVSCIRNFSWLALSDSFPETVIEECKTMFDERVAQRFDYIKEVCKTFSNWTL